MMRQENHGDQEADLHASQDDMESLVLDEPPSSNGQSSPSPSTSVDRHSATGTTATSSQGFNSILEPPSYADAIFTSFDSSSSNGHESPRPSSYQSEPPTRSEFLKIWVSDPQKELELNNSLVPGGTSYYTYLITTRTNMPEYGGPGTEFTLRRRFKDVVTLSDRLSESFRGFFIPIRPDKSVVESQVMQIEQFVELRRAALAKYLNKLAVHPTIKKSEELRLFLVVKGKLPLTRSIDMASRVLDGAVRLPRQLTGEVAVVTDVNEAAQPAKGGRDLLRIFRELKQAVVNDWGGVKPMAVEDDKEFLERKEKVAEFEQQLSNLSQQAESLVKAQQDMGETLGELGLAFVKLTKLETEGAMFEPQTIRANDMKNVATASVKASRLYRELNAQTVKHLDKLHEYLGVMLAVNSAFSDRSSALLTVQTLSSELVSLQSRIEKLEAAASKIFGGDRSRMRKIEELKETLKISEDAKSCAVREYERIKENNRSELERLDRERHEDFMGMLRGFVLNQAGYAEKMANAWEKLAEETSGRAYKQLQEQQKRLLAQQEELVNLDQGGGGDEAFAMEEDDDDHHRRRRASHSRRIMQAMGQIAKPGRAANIDRRRERRGKDLLEDYFIPNSVYPDHVFRRRFRMQRSLFAKIMSDVCNHDPYFVQKEDAFHVLGLLPEQKITAALRMLAYGASADQVDEIARMGKTTVMESLMRFCSAIEALYTNEYLRQPTPRDMQRLLRKAEMRGFPGMIGSIDCMHWTWKNCPSAWQGAYGDRKGAKSIILEAVASFDTWIWHAFFGVPGAQNDLNVLAQSPVFDELLQGRGPRCTYWVNGTKYEGPYYLADGIYPRWSTFVKTVPHPQSEKEKHFAKCQEGCRKDVERCFGILQARWAIVRAAARMFDVEALRSIMMTCIILHNMIVEDEYDYDAVDEYEPDPMNNSRTQIYYAHDRTEDPVQHEPLERDGRYNELIVQRYTSLQEPYWHISRQNDLIEHQWSLHEGEDN